MKYTKYKKSAACDRGWDMFTSTVTTAMANTCDKRSKSAFRVFCFAAKDGRGKPQGRGPAHILSQ